MKPRKAADCIFGLLVLAIVFFLGYLLGDNANDGVRVVIEKEEVVQVQQVTSEETEIVYPLDLNEATQGQLETLPGVGPKLAEEIVTYRSTYGGFVDKTQIMDVPGIGEKKYEALEQLIIVKEAGKNENSSGG